MNVTKDKLKNRQFHKEGQLQMITAEQGKYAEAFACQRITQNTDTVTDFASCAMQMTV